MASYLTGSGTAGSAAAASPNNAAPSPSSVPLSNVSEDGLTTPIGKKRKHDEPAEAPPKSEPFDLASKRSSIHRTCMRELKAQEKKLMQTAAALAVSLQAHKHNYTGSSEIEYHSAVERLQVVLLMLGLKPTAEAGAEAAEGALDYNALTPLRLGDCGGKECSSTGEIQVAWNLRLRAGHPGPSLLPLTLLAPPRMSADLNFLNKLVE